MEIPMIAGVVLENDATLLGMKGNKYGD